MIHTSFSKASSFSFPGRITYFTCILRVTVLQAFPLTTTFTIELFHSFLSEPAKGDTGKCFRRGTQDAWSHDSTISQVYNLVADVLLYIVFAKSGSCRPSSCDEALTRLGYALFDS